MSSVRLLWQSLLYYWRTNLAVLLGVIAGTAVIGGALIVGDSVRGSLETMSRERLGDIDYALSSHRFVRESLAKDLAARVKQSDGNAASSESETSSKITIAPALVMVGAIERKLQTKDEDSNTQSQYARAGQVHVYGLNQGLWGLTNHGDVPRPTGKQIIISGRLAEQLGQTEAGINKPLEVGDEVTLWIELPASIPRDTLLGDREQQTSVNIPLEVSQILPDRSGVGRLELHPSQQLPLNAFLDLETLQKALGLNARRVRDPIRRKIIEEPARVNAIFVGTHNPAVAEEQAAIDVAENFDQRLEESLNLQDLSLRIVSHTDEGYFSLESRQQILANPFAAAARKAAKELKLPTSPALVYIANEIDNADVSQVRHKTQEAAGPGLFDVFDCCGDRFGADAVRFPALISSASGRNRWAKTASF